MMQETNRLLKDAAKLARKGKLADAISAYERVLQLDPMNANASFALGNIARKLDMAELAETMYRQTLAINPTSIEASTNLAVLFHEQGRDVEAIGILEPMTIEHPGEHILWLNLGVSYFAEDDFSAAQDSYEKALKLSPRNARLLGNIAELKFELGEFDEALVFLNKAVKQAPGDPNLRYNRALSHLGVGNLELGWREAEHRLRPQINAAITYDHKLPTWRGQNLEGKKILVSGEQGIGDQILFISPLPDIIALADETTIEVEPRLVSLFTRSFPDATIKPYQQALEGGVRKFKYDWDVDALDYAIPMISLFRHLRPTLESFQTADTQLVPDQATVNSFRAELDKVPGKTKIGICWRGGIGKKSRIKTFAKLEDYLPVLKLPDATFYTLMYDQLTDDEQVFLRENNITLHTIEGLDLRDDLDRIAALCKALDLVISAPSAPGNLAGIVGTKTFMPHYLRNWMMLGINAIPFARHITAYHNTERDNWQPNIARMIDDIEEFRTSP